MEPNRGAAFPVTRLSVLAAAKSPDREIRSRALEAFVAAYWKPVYKYLRVKWSLSGPDAEDLTQEFFVRAFEKGYFDGYDRRRARFRTFLRTCLDGFAANVRKAERRLKRGGAILTVPLDFQTAEGELGHHDVPADTLDLDQYFHQEWLRSLLGLVVDTLRQRWHAAGRATQFSAFVRYDLERPADGSHLTYRQLADDLGLSVTDVTNALAAARREFRAVLLERLRELCPSADEFEDEVRHLLGVSGR